MKRFVFAASACLAAAAPAQAQDEVTLLRTVRAIGDATSGQRIGGGHAADKLVYLGRNAQGAVVVRSIAALVPGGEGVDPPQGTTAVIRTRASTGNGNRAPEASDLAFAARAGMPLFIVGEWSTPPRIWEVARRGPAAAFRDIDAQGRAGPWQTPAP
jgi:hypothetical protein